jgi:hypothetical protein
MNNDTEGESANGDGLKARAAEKIQEFRSSAQERAQEVGTLARHRAEEQLESQRERIASSMEEAAEGLMRHAEHAAGLQHDAEARVAHGMGTAAGYLHTHRSGQVTRDLQGLVRSHPVPSLLVALIAGYLLLRLLR